MKRAKFILAAVCTIFVAMLVTGCLNAAGDDVSGTTSGTWYSYEATINDIPYHFNASGTCTDNVSESTKNFVEDLFIKFTLTSDGHYTSYITGGYELWSENVAEACTYTLRGDTLTISTGLVCTASGDEYTAISMGQNYKFKKVN
ncbi:MAG: hypothetical protein J6Y69_07310 [Treponema sp.]|nr:hypothetical protein [Treponema sp.]